MTLKKITIIIYLMLFISCVDQKEITEISLNESNGGKLGFYSKLEITKKHICYVSGNIKLKKEIKVKTSKKLWDNLTKLNINDFSKVKSSPGRMAYDGTDVEVSILFGNKLFSIVNGQDDTLNYKKIKLFVSALENQKKVMYQKKQTLKNYSVLQNSSK